MPDAYGVVVPERRAASVQHHFVGDFGKYGLLRALTGTCPVAEQRLSLGVVWYLPAGATGSAVDGQKLSYLNQPSRFRSCDPRLYDALGQLFDGGDRSLGAVEATGILGDGTVFFDGPVPQDQWSRRKWFQQAVQGRDVVFLDPDKGLAPPSAGLSSTEHAYVCELEAFVRRGQTVVVYHHLGRTAAHPVQMRDWAERLARTELDIARHDYNTRCLHASLGYVTPDDEHCGRGDTIRQARQDGLNRARLAPIAYHRNNN